MEKTGLLDLFGKKVYIETYGCRYNFGDTAKLIEILRYQGCRLTDTAEYADAVIINTCTVVASTERKMLKRLSHFRNRDLYVAGCMPVVQRDAILEVCLPKFIPPRAIQKCYQAVRTVSPSSVGIVQISEGCNGHCTYCITKKARGSLKSFSAQEILLHTRALVQSGAVEIQLTAQDVSGWGRDIGANLPELLHGIENLPGTFYMRAGMMNPATVAGILDDLVDAFALEKMFKFIHIPVQSGSDRILEAMGRDYTTGEFEDIIAAFRKKFPDITVATDIIVGYPGENDDDFLQSVALIDRIRPNKVNVTRFSKRPFTQVFLKKDVLGAVKKDRSRTLIARAEKIYHAINAPYIGRTVPFIVTERIRKGSVMARTPAYIGVVIRENLPPGFTGQASLRHEKSYFFIGERIGDAPG
jgi:MiaB-like tRNA modifying enzyme